MSHGSNNPACWDSICVSSPSLCKLQWSRATSFCIKGPCTDIVGDTSICSPGEPLLMRRKATVLQYNKNSANLTKKQKWSQLANGKSHNKKQVWATQSDIHSNPNTDKLEQKGYTLICPSLGAIISHSSSASGIKCGNSILRLNKQLPPWGTGPQRRSFAMGNVMHPSGKAMPPGPPPPVPASTACRQCTCNNNIGGWWGNYTDCIFLGDGPNRTYGPFGCYACENGEAATTAIFLRHTESDPASCAFNPDHCSSPP